jgi:hypothetical protein
MNTLLELIRFGFLEVNQANKQALANVYCFTGVIAGECSWGSTGPLMHFRHQIVTTILPNCPLASR